MDDPSEPTIPARRPAVSVVIPFAGDRADASRMLASLARLEFDEADELIVADNTATGVARAVLDGAVATVHANREASSYHARNEGAKRASKDWLLFIDADCEPAPDLLDSYFAAPIDDRCGSLAGEIAGDDEAEGFLASYSRSRNLVSQRDGLHARSGRTAATGNLMIRRAAFDDVGGFADGIRSGGDVDICLRMHTAGWTLAYRPAAIVVHPHRSSVRSLLGATARYAAGARWLDERHGNVTARWPLLPGIQGSLRDVAGRTIAGEREEAAFRLLDGIGLVAHAVGYRASNRAGSPA